MSATIGNIEEAARAIVGMSSIKPKIISTNIQKEIEIMQNDPEIKKILETEGFKQITFLKDLLNKKRAVFAK